jgi:hypothetical protein
MAQEHRSSVTTVADLHRLAEFAHARGLRVFEAAPHQWFCTSHSDPFAPHVVTGFSCDCAGFVRHQRCTHHSLLLAHLGWLPELEDEASVSIDCPDCCGCGQQWYRSGYSLPCETCRGTGIKATEPPAGQPATRPVAAAA